MKKIKKIMAMLLAMVMVLGMTVTAMAEKVEDENLNKTITVKNLSQDVETTLKLYNIIYLDRDTTQNESWVVVDWAKSYVEEKNGEFTIKDKSGLKKAAEAANPEQTVKENGTSHTFTNLPIGAYIILAEDEKGTYGLMVANTYDENQKYLAAKTADVVAKVEGHIVTKETTDKFVGIGSEVTFTVTTQVPSKKNVNGDVLKNFKVIDKPAGLLINGLPTVTIGGVTKTIAEDMVVNTKDSKSKRTIEYTVDLSSFINESEAGATVVVTYTATVVDGTYSNEAGVESDTVKYTPGEVYGYTGDITITKYASDNDNDNLVNNEKLEGAKFKVYTVQNEVVSENALQFIEEENGVYRLALPDEVGAIDEIEVSSEGTVKVKGLAEGKYHFEETVAPDGYSVNEDGVTVEITANENDNVSVSDDVIDTKLSSLPSTGGIGTTIFTIGGCAIMVAAAGLFFASRRKANK